MNYVLNEEKMFADVTDGIAIIINSETGIYYGLNQLATAVYENLINGASTDAILDELKSIQGVPVDIESRFNSFIEDMMKAELLIRGEDSDAFARIAASIAQEDNFVMEVKAYDDAQELLLADPIHEVKEETGLDVEVEKIIAIQDRNKHNKPIYAYGVCKIFSQCKILSGEFVENIETTETRFFGKDELPKNLAKEKVNKQ